MAFVSLKYDSAPNIDETRQGIFIHEWEFRTMLEINTTKTEDMKKTMNSIIKVLRGESTIIGMDGRREDPRAKWM